MENILPEKKDFSVEQAEYTFNEVKRSYERIYLKYSGIKRLFKRNLSKEDRYELSVCQLFLSNLNNYDVVQRGESRIVNYRSMGKLSFDIIDFIFKFKENKFERELDDVSIFN